jgi:hypothetical protein
MLRISAAIAVLTLIATAAFGVSSAQAIVCSYDECVSNCHGNGISKYCLRVCDRRLARRQSSGLCKWPGLGDLSLNR